MAKEEGYNGWTNYETWNVALWMDNERGSYDYWRERAQEAFDNAKKDRSLTKKERASIDLQDMLKNEFEEAKDIFLEKADGTASMWADLLGGALSEVNWREIANNLLEETEEKK